MSVRPVRLLTAAATLTIVLSSTACGSHEKEKPLPIKREADVVAMLKSYGDTTAAIIGAPLEKWETVPAPCQDSAGETATDGRFNVTGNANIRVPEDQHVTVLEELRDQWRQQHYEITEFRTFPPDNRRGVVAGRNPTDGVSISVESTQPPQAFALLIATPCYEPAPGERPGG